MQTIRIALSRSTALTPPPRRSRNANPIDDCNQSADLEKQIDGCTEFLEVDPFSPHVALAYGRRGEAYVHKGDFARAIADFDQAIRIDPRQARFLVAAASLIASTAISFRARRFQQGHRDRLHALPTPSSIVASLRGQGEPDLAVKDCTAGPSPLNLHGRRRLNDRGVAYEKTGNLDGALADYSNAIELDPRLIRDALRILRSASAKSA